jgi:hypothetical protein
MKIDILTLLPEIALAPLSDSIIQRARDAGLVEVHGHNLRDWSEDKHKRVDDSPCGGGPGMVMMAEPLERAIREASIARLRPILLTAISSLAGFVPLLVASGFGSGSRVSIGTVVFSGLLASTALSLLVVPVIYRLVKRWELGPRPGREPGAPA